MTPAASRPRPPFHPRFWIRWISRIHPVSSRHDVFFTREDGIPMVTMLFLALLAIETADIIFALDSIPAVLSITRQPFLAYTSNILAVMGLRSLFFLLAKMLRQMRFLHFGLAAILAFASLRMLTTRWIEIGPIPALRRHPRHSRVHYRAVTALPQIGVKPEDRDRVCTRTGMTNLSSISRRSDARLDQSCPLLPS